MTTPFSFPQACGVQEARVVQPTRKLVVKGGVEVEFRRGDRPMLIVAGETADAVASVKTTYKDDKLVVEREGVTIAVGGSVMVFRGSVGSIVMGNGNIVSGLPNGSAVSLRQERVVVGVVLPALPAVKLKGSGVVTLHDLRQPRLELEVTGSGDIIATGQVGSLDARVAGSGDVEARKLAAERADLSVSGSGDIVARVQVEVRARVAGSGDIVVHGDPPQRDHRVAGSGDIRFL